jgi:hypothetical protein
LRLRVNGRGPAQTLTTIGITFGIGNTFSEIHDKLHLTSFDTDNYPIALVKVVRLLKSLSRLVSGAEHTYGGTGALRLADRLGRRLFFDLINGALYQWDALSQSQRYVLPTHQVPNDHDT